MATALVEMALGAGDRVGTPRIEQLTVRTPLVLPPRGALHFQILIDEPSDGGRAVAIYSRVENRNSWTLHADGVLGQSRRPAIDIGLWPDVAVGAAITSGAETWVDVEVDEPTDGFALHPTLLADVLGLARPGSSPTHWRGVEVTASGASRVRTRVSATGVDTTALIISDSSGGTVAVADEVRLTTYTDAAMSSALLRPSDTLLRPSWISLVRLDDSSSHHGEVVSHAPELDLHKRTQATLESLQRWIELNSGTKLVIVTRGAFSVSGEPITDLAGASVWGLVRSAQSEHPGKFVLIDADESPTDELIARAVSSGESQVAIRGEQLLAPRLRRGPSDIARPSGHWHGTVLITGGTGALGRILARHLVINHEVRSLVLTSRSGIAAFGARALVDELTGLGAKVEVVACDISDRNAVGRLVAEHPLNGVIHAAGVTDDGLIDKLTPTDLFAVLAAKADGARHLHELAGDVSAFVLFSSLAATIGGAGQSNYAAANAYLDGIATMRAVEGKPATSIAWGLWNLDSGVTSHLGAADRRRIERAGYLSIDPVLGVAALDAAVGDGAPVLVSVPLDETAMRTRPDQLPAVFREIIRVPLRRSATGPENSGSWADRIGTLTPDERSAAVLAEVLDTVRGVLGHADSESIHSTSAFSDLGFDSLLSVELRNRLAMSSGLTLPLTALFDHPTPTALADHLDGQLTPDGNSDASGVDWDAEIALPDDIEPSSVRISATDDPECVLLTGATGFLGAFVLRELLQLKRARVLCLIRAEDTADAWRKLRENLTWYRIQGDMTRVEIVVGDLGAASLGLPAEEFDRLATTVDAIYHAGAQVNWLQPYQALKAVNVEGTIELLRLAAMHRTVPLHHVSTTGVYAGPATPGVALRVGDPAGPGDELPSGYTQSKWVAEEIIGLARERGLPVSVYRVDLISGDRVTGACQKRDYVWLALKG